MESSFYVQIFTMELVVKTLKIKIFGMALKILI